MEAYLYDKSDNREVVCRLCRHRCTIRDGRRGICGVRKNRGGVLETLVYDRVIARHVDPIEKKPLFHFHPGSLSYSVATVGCNFRCRFCQNADIAQMPRDQEGRIAGSAAAPDDIVAAAKNANCRSIAYTYTEPTVFFELAYDIARLAHPEGLANVFVTNGYLSADALHMIAPFLDAANVDVKAFNEDFYRRYCGASLEPVKETLVLMKQLGVLVEVTTLIIPGLNDDPGELASLAAFLVDALGPETPWHISRFHPTYQLTDRPATPLKSLLMARDLGLKAGLRYVYTGNVPGQEGENTFCYACGKAVIERRGFQIKRRSLVNGCCGFCGAPIDGSGL